VQEFGIQTITAWILTRTAAYRGGSVRRDEMMEMNLKLAAGLKT
jgi:hypothetical protein